AGGRGFEPRRSRKGPANRALFVADLGVIDRWLLRILRRSRARLGLKSPHDSGRGRESLQRGGPAHPAGGQINFGFWVKRERGRPDLWAGRALDCCNAADNPVPFGGRFGRFLRQPYWESSLGCRLRYGSTGWRSGNRVGERNRNGYSVSRGRHWPFASPPDV